MLQNQIMPEGFQHDNVLELLHIAKERRQVVPAEIISVVYPDDVPTWVLRFRDYPDFTGFVPAKETGVPEYLINRFIGQVINVHILGIDKENNYLACTRRSAVEAIEGRVRENLAEDSIITAVVKAILPRIRENPAQLVVDVGGGVLSYIPSREAKIRLSQRLDQQFVVGQALKVKVLSTEPELEVSAKAARPDPWQTTVFNRGQFISGTILNITDNIVFIEPDLAPGIVGIAPVPVLGRIARKDKVNCFVVKCDNVNKKLKLNIKSRIL